MQVVAAAPRVGLEEQEEVRLVETVRTLRRRMVMAELIQVVVAAVGLPRAHRDLGDLLVVLA
jgi:hypothetical protein